MADFLERHGARPHYGTARSRERASAASSAGVTLSSHSLKLCRLVSLTSLNAVSATPRPAGACFSAT